MINRNRFRHSLKARLLRALLEVTGILFLFYSNLLMGEFVRSNYVQGKTLLWALYDIFTVINFEIGLVTAILGYGVFEFLRRRL